MFEDGDLTLQRIVAICVWMLSVYSDESLQMDDFIWLMISSFGILLSTTAKLRPLASTEIVMGDRLLLDKFLIVLNWEDWELLCGLRLLYFFICCSVNCTWMFWDCSYVVRSKIYQMSCRNVEERRKWNPKDFWKILFIRNLVKLMRSLVRIRSVL